MTNSRSDKDFELIGKLVTTASSKLGLDALEQALNIARTLDADQAKIAENTSQIADKLVLLDTVNDKQDHLLNKIESLIELKHSLENSLDEAISNVQNEVKNLGQNSDNFNEVSNKLDFQIQSLETISAGFADSIVSRLQDAQTREKIGIELGSQVDNATKYLVTRFRDNLNNEKIQLGIAEQVAEVLQSESDNLSNEIQQLLRAKENSGELVKNLKLSRLALDKNNLSESLASENERLKKELVATEQLALKYQNRANQLIAEKDNNSFSLSQMLAGIAIAYLVFKPFVDPILSKFL